MTTKCHVPRVKMNRLYFVLTSLATRVPSATTERRHPMIVEDIILLCGILTNKSSNWLDLDLIELSVPNNSSFYTKIPHAIIELFQEKMIPLYGACPSVLIVIIKCKKKKQQENRMNNFRHESDEYRASDVIKTKVLISHIRNNYYVGNEIVNSCLFLSDWIERI